MNILDIENIFGSSLKVTAIEEFVRKNKGGFTLQVPLPAINSTQDYIDIVEDYLTASIIGESLAELSKSINCNKVWGQKVYPVYHFQIIPLNHSILSKTIYEFSLVFDCADDEHDDVRIDWLEKLEEYEKNLDKKVFHFPEIIDDYYANLINGHYYQLEPKELSKIYKKYPERKYGFWKSAFSKTFGSDFYVSPESWIVTKGTDIKKLLEKYSDIKYSTEFETAELFVINNISYLINANNAVYFPFDSFLKSKSCTEVALLQDSCPHESDHLTGLLTFSEIRSAYKELIPIASYTYEYILTKNADVLIIKDPFNAFSYIFFDCDKVNERDILLLNEKVVNIHEKLNVFAGSSADIVLPWDSINEDIFEQICYEIIYYNPKYNNTTIRKIGKTKSRDGGRDIEVFTYSRPGKEPEKYIFQCKYLKQGKSLSGSRIQNISDVIAQYGAEGYGVMTSAVIDATLYDKLDGIARNKDVKVETWSVFEIDRFLTRNNGIKKRYFK